MGKRVISQILITTGEIVQTSMIYCGDCQRILAQSIPASSIDVIYMDPPFFSSRQYEVLWGDGYELRAFEDRWKGGIENYIAWMEPKLRECYRVLKKTGTMWLHCDWHAQAYLRVIMDKIFGDSNLINEIVWKRSAAHGDTKQGAKHFGRLHDIILVYSKGQDYVWNMQYISYDDEYVSNFYKNIEPKTGRRYMVDNLTAAKPGGDTSYMWKGAKPSPGRYWAYSKEKMEEFERQGRLVYPKKKGGMPRYKRYLDEMSGMPLQDIWIDIPPIHSKSKERMGYPTQKPERLLERILKTASNSGDTVLDPMCGCGTAIAVAHKLKRQWIGIDVSPTAGELMVKRMRKLGAMGIQIEGLPKNIDELRSLQPFEFQNWICQKTFARVSERKVGDMGIDGWMMDGRPLQIKQSESIGRNVIDNFETAIKRVKKNKGVIIAFSFGKGAYEEVARVKNAEGVEIELKTVDDVMNEI
jgi:DNA modification methylase